MSPSYCEHSEKEKKEKHLWFKIKSQKSLACVIFGSTGEKIDTCIENEISMLNVFDTLPDLPTEGLDYKQTATYTCMTLEKRLSGHEMVSVLSWIFASFWAVIFSPPFKEKKRGTLSELSESRLCIVTAH